VLRKRNGMKHILLVDDDNSITKMLCMLLESRGYAVEVASSGKEALERVSHTTDLILLDLILPDLEGFEVCRQLKEDQRTQHIPVIILSAKLLRADKVEGLYLGADDYLTKPFEYEELVARIEVVLRRGELFWNGKVSSKGEEALIGELRKIIDEARIESFFQPLFTLHPVQLMGFEALSRPCTDTLLNNPELLFKAALQFGLYQEIEMLSWQKALSSASKFLKEKKLFLNCNPYLVEGPRFLEIKSLFEDNNINVSNVVLEITERSAISDFKIFYKHLRHYRDYGFKFAVDDVGGGYASLEAIVETKPEVVKIDRHIIQDIHKDEFKRSIVKFIVAFCKENKIISIAEGIEVKEDLEAIKALGIDAAQGYYLYKPNKVVDFDEIEKSIKAFQ